MARVPIVLGMILLAAGGGLVGYTVTRDARRDDMAPEISAAMQRAQDGIGAKISSASASVRSKARTLAFIPTLQKGILTDYDSLVDQLNNKDIGANAEENQVIEFGQLPKKGGAPTVLLRLPEKAKAANLNYTAKDDAIRLDGEVVVVATVAPFEAPDDPSYKDIRADHAGFVAVSQRIDLHDDIATLAKVGYSGDFSIGDSSIPIGAVVEPGAELGSMNLNTKPQARLRYVLPPTIGKPPSYFLAGGAGAAVFGLVLVVAGMMRSKRPSDPSASTIPGIGSDGKFMGSQAMASTMQVQVPSVPAGTASQPPASGQMFGRWEVVRRLGSGGMADVYLARARGEAGFEKMVALKVMHAHLARNERAVEHFLDEAKLAANVHHPNVVAIQDLGKIGNDYAIVMEYVDGVDLERLLMSARTGSRPVPVAVGLGILCRICDGLSAAHKATNNDGTPLGIIHRDVKSANVLVSRQGGVKVVDFGIAKAATQSHLTIAGETKGTPSMMAPEQRVGEAVDVRADVYSVAAVGFEILTNHGVNLDLAALAHLGVENWPHLPLPSTLRPELPTDVDALLLGAMAFERDKRPVDCDTFEASCEAVMRKHNLTATDKDIARWVETEMAFVTAQAAVRAPTDLANKRTG